MYDESIFLALIFAAQEQNFELHLVEERELLPKCFAFNHINYSRYLTFQHVNFSEIKHCNDNVWNDLLREGFRGSLSGEPFSSIHGDLITEPAINREVKVRDGPMTDGYMLWQKSGQS